MYHFSWHAGFVGWKVMGKGLWYKQLYTQDFTTTSGVLCRISGFLQDWKQVQYCVANEQKYSQLDTWATGKTDLKSDLQEVYSFMPVTHPYKTMHIIQYPAFSIMILFRLIFTFPGSYGHLMMLAMQIAGGARLSSISLAFPINEHPSDSDPQRKHRRDHHPNSIAWPEGKTVVVDALLNPEASWILESLMGILIKTW